MELLTGISFFLLGAVIGSFLNVVIARIATGEGLMGRSHCPRCGSALSWRELIPIFSFIIQRWRCVHCKNVISWQYPIVEALTGCMFLAVYFTFGFSFDPYSLVRTLYLLVSVSLLIAIFFYDLKHLIIPNVLVYAFNLLAFAALFVDFDAHIFVVPGLFEILAGPVLFFPFFALWYISNGRWLGFGDGKLALGIGWSLGLVAGTSAVLLSFWIGATVSIALMYLPPLFKRICGQRALRHIPAHLTMKSEVPFAPFLIIGWALVLFLHLDIISSLLFV